MQQNSGVFLALAWISSSDGVESEILKTLLNLGADATKFRSVFRIWDSTPSDELIQANAKIQATLAKMTQDAGMVPMIEPEVLRNGSHNLQKDIDVTGKVQDEVFEEVKKAGVDLTTSILKPNMITPGEDSTDTPTVEEVAQATLDV